MRMLVALAVLTATICCTAVVEAQPGRGGPPGTPPDLKRLESEIQKLKATLEEAEAKMKAARDLARKSGDAEKGKGKDEKGKDEKGKFEPWGGFGKGGFGKGGFGGPWGDKFKLPEAGKTPEKTKTPPAPVSESDRILAELKKILAAAEKKDDRKAPEPTRGFGPPWMGRREEGKTPAAPATPSLEKRMEALEKAVEEIRAQLRRR